MELNKIYCGDCLELMKSIDDGSIDLILADPPFGTTRCKWDSVIPFKPMWKQLKRIIKPYGAIVLNASQPFTSALIMSNIDMFKYCWVWEKTQAVGHLNAYKMPMKNTEDICVFYKSHPVYNPQITNKKKENIRPATKIRKNSECYGAHYKPSKRKLPKDKTLPNQILKFRNSQRGLHPTQKPVALMEYLIKTYTNKDELVLDFTIGSGTTAVACRNTHRNFIGIELSPEYCKIANRRILNAEPQLF